MCKKNDPLQSEKVLHTLARNAVFFNKDHFLGAETSSNKSKVQMKP